MHFCRRTLRRAQEVLSSLSDFPVLSTSHRPSQSLRHPIGKTRMPYTQRPITAAPSTEGVLVSHGTFLLSLECWHSHSCHFPEQRARSGEAEEVFWAPLATKLCSLALAPKADSRAPC